MGKVSRRLQYYLYMHKTSAKGSTRAVNHPGTYTHPCSDMGYVGGLNGSITMGTLVNEV